MSCYLIVFIIVLGFLVKFFPSNSPINVIFASRALAIVLRVDYVISVEVEV